MWSHFMILNWFLTFFIAVYDFFYLGINSCFFNQQVWSLFFFSEGGGRPGVAVGVCVWEVSAFPVFIIYPLFLFRDAKACLTRHISALCRTSSLGVQSTNCFFFTWAMRQHSKV